MKLNSLLVFFVLTALFFNPTHLTANDEVCSVNVETRRENALTALSRLEDHFRNAGWNYRKYQEIVYNPLWQAALNRRDLFSSELKIEGEVLYRRYRLYADQELKRSENDMGSAFQQLEIVKQGLAQEDSCGGALKSSSPGENISQFNNCMSVWIAKTVDLIHETERSLRRYQKKQGEFSELLESRLSDNSSEHDTFEDRYFHHFYEFDLKTQTLFLLRIRQIQEQFELKWTADTCCSACRADKLSRWDPVLSQLKLDPQGDSGVAGNLVNNARLKQAFERYEKEQTPEGFPEKNREKN